MNAEAEKAFETHYCDGCDRAKEESHDERGPWRHYFLEGAAWQRERDAQICDKRAARMANTIGKARKMEAETIAAEIRKQDGAP